ncbi:MAG TPA: RDD family protein [Chryseosolibacter sp.]|nr:RDD family protein [Chryseosolibacter sp.]
MVLQYELADLRDRILAFLIDLICLFFGLIILSLVFNAIFTGIALDAMNILIICIFIFYSLVFEVLNHGQSIGKMAMGIQVIKITSGNATFADYAARWVFRMADIYLSLGGIASILIASSSKAQRIGDIVANTTVIKLTPAMNLTLEDILNIHSQGSYQPEFIQARQLMEEDVLLIKMTLDRFRKFRNQAHRQALDMLADKIYEVIQAEKRQMDNQQFLETVLKDYVMLTR